MMSVCRKRALRAERRRNHFALLLLSTTALVGLTAPTLAADTIWTGATDTDWSLSTNWDTSNVPTNADNVFVNTTTGFPVIGVGTSAAGAIVTIGDTAAGALQIQGTGAELNATSLVLGDGAQGNLSVANTGALNLTNDFYVGQGANGFATITGSSALTAGNGLVGFGDNTTGQLTFANSATGTFSSNLSVGIGMGSDGTLTINTGADVDTVNLNLGSNVGAQGTALVTGTGSTLDISAFVTIGDSGTGILTIADNAVVTANLNNNVNVGNTASANGTVTVSSGGSLTLGGPFVVGNLGTGTLTVDSAGTVSANSFQIGGGAGGIGTATVTGVGSILMANGLVVGNSGAGTLLVEDDADVIVTNNVVVGNYSGANGTATVTGSGSSLSAGGILYVGFDTAGDLTIADGGNVSATNGIQVGVASPAGDGAIVVTGANSQLVGNNGLSIGVSGGMGAVTVSDSGALMVTSGTTFVGTAVNSVGTLTITGAGASYSGDFMNVGQSGTGALIIADGATAVTADASIGTQASGEGSALVTGVGTMWTTGATLHVGTSGDGRLTVAEGANVNVDGGAGTLTIAQNASAGGEVIIGAQALSAAVGAGTLNVANVNFGAGTGSLIFNHTDTNYAFDAAISGVGTINHVAGVTNLTGDSSGFNGLTNVVGGSLYVNNILGGGVVVAGGTLGGSGTLGVVGILSGGTIAPGNSIGTLNVASITMNAGSTYTVELNDGGFVAGTNNDLINATGTATINGGTVHVTPANGTDTGTTYTAGTYTILTAAGGVTGEFDTLTDNYAFLNFALAYDANNVFLTSSLAAATFCLSGMSANQCAAGEGVFSLGSGSLYTAVLNLSNAEAPGALDLLSGEVHASAKTALIEDSRFVREAAVARTRAAFDAVASDRSATGEQRISDRFAFWGQGFGSWGDWDSDGNAGSLNRSIGGLFLGADAGVSDHVRIGALAGYSHSDFDVGARASSGAAESGHAALYGGGQWGALGLRFGGAYGWHEIETARTVAFTGFSDRLEASYDAATAQAFGEAAWRIDTGANTRFEPFANLAYVSLDTDALSETGGAAALSVASHQIDAPFLTLGLRADTAFLLGRSKARLTGSLGWQHVFGDDVPVSLMTFATGGDPFAIAGVPLAENVLVVDTGLVVTLAPDATLGITYGGQFGAEFIDQSVKGGVNVKF